MNAEHEPTTPTCRSGALYRMLCFDNWSGWRPWKRDPARRRRRIAEKRLGLRMAAARQRAEAGNLCEMAELCSAALIGLAADVADRTEIEATAAEAHWQLEQTNVRPEIRRQFGEMLAQCDAVRIGGLDVQKDLLLDRAERLARRLIAELRGGK